MSNSFSDAEDGSNKRNPPSWMSSKEKGGNPCNKKQEDDGEEATNQVIGRGNIDSVEASQSIPHFSKLMDGVVFVLSGFVNPERSTLRSQALDMGAVYRPDWTSDCTLLVCAFANTPKFRQVESDCGTIVSKEWISECHSQKKLVDIERFLMHAGKPWRKNSWQIEINRGKRSALQEEPKKQPRRSSPEKPTVALHEGSKKQPRKKSPEKPTGSRSSKGGPFNTATNYFAPSKLKEWAAEDLNKTVSWLESQEEKPEASEVKAIAAQGIITCLQDAIESLKQNKDIQLVMEQWMFVPRIVKELAEFVAGRSKKGSLSKEELSESAIRCKDVYKKEFDKADTSPIKNKKQKGDNNEDINAANLRVPPDDDDAGFDSDQTVEMTEEEIEMACKQMNS